MNRTRKYRFNKGGADNSAENAAVAAAFAENPALGQTAAATKVATEAAEAAEEAAKAVGKFDEAGNEILKTATTLADKIKKSAVVVQDTSEKAIENSKKLAKSVSNKVTELNNLIINKADYIVDDGVNPNPEERQDSNIFTPADNLKKSADELLKILKKDCQSFDDTHINFLEKAIVIISQKIPDIQIKQLADFLTFYGKSHPDISCMAKDDNWKTIYKEYNKWRNAQIDPQKLTKILQEFSTESKMQLIFGSNLDPIPNPPLSENEKANKDEYGQLATNIKTLIMNVLNLLLEVNNFKINNKGESNHIINNLFQEYNSIKTLLSQ